MVVYKNYGRYDKSNIVIEGNMVKQYSKKRKTRDTIYIDYGASMLRKNVLDIVPQSTPYSLEELFLKLISRKEVLAFEVKKRFYEIGSKKGLLEFQKFISRKVSQGHDNNQNTHENFSRGRRN